MRVSRWTLLHAYTAAAAHPKGAQAIESPCATVFVAREFFALWTLLYDAWQGQGASSLVSRGWEWTRRGLAGC